MIGSLNVGTGCNMYAGAALGSEFCYCHTCRVDSPHALTLPLTPLTFPFTLLVLQTCKRPNLHCTAFMLLPFLPLFHPFWTISQFDIQGVPLHLRQIIQPLFIVKVFWKARLDLPIHLTRLFLPIPLSEVITTVWPR